jgi:hypothetical protein
VASQHKENATHFFQSRIEELCKKREREVEVIEFYDVIIAMQLTFRSTLGLPVHNAGRVLTNQK